MDITAANQLRELFFSCGMGFFLGAYYTVFRVIRLIMRSKGWAVFFQDVFFFVTAAVITFLFSLAVMDGHLRFYLFVGEVVGFFAFYHTVGRLVVRFAQAVVRFVIRVWSAFWKLVTAPFRWVWRKFEPLRRKIKEYFQKKVDRLLNIFKKGLKRLHGLLYNRKEAKKAGKNAKNGKPPIPAKK